MTDRATAGPYTLVMPANSRATLYEADGAGEDHEVPWGADTLSALVQFAGEVIRLNAMLDAMRLPNAEIVPSLDPRGPDYAREGIFRDHNCWKCNSGANPCATGNPHQCEYPHARND